MDQKWWKRDPDRLQVEQDYMSRRYGDRFQLKKRNGHLGWYGPILSQIRGEIYVVSMVYPQNYPSAEPKVYIQEPQIEPDISFHMYADGKLCLAQEWKRKDTAVKIMARTAGWILAYEYYQDYLKPNGKSWKHPKKIKDEQDVDPVDTIVA